MEDRLMDEWALDVIYKYISEMHFRKWLEAVQDTDPTL